MGKLRERNTGSIVNVPDEDEAGVLALGYYEKADKTAEKKSAAKKSSK
jgi:hypothetical protein